MHPIGSKLLTTCKNFIHIQLELLVISVDLNVIDQKLVRYSEVITYWKENGFNRTVEELRTNFKKQYHFWV
jgi:hypothetical protein